MPIEHRQLWHTSDTFMYKSIGKWHRWAPRSSLLRTHIPVPLQYQQHRHGTRSSSNIAQGYGTHGSYQCSSNNNPYSNNTALGMCAVSNNASQSNPAKHGVQTNYFWTCSHCLQMVDPSLSSCHVMTDNDTHGNILQQTHIPPNNGNNNGYKLTLACATPEWQSWVAMAAVQWWLDSKGTLIHWLYCIGNDFKNMRGSVLILFVAIMNSFIYILYGHFSVRITTKFGAHLMR